MEYFKHDINASEDDKICDLLANGGYEMLGYYWRFIEYLYGRNGKVDKTKLKGIAWSLHMEFEKLESVINDYDLFCEDDECIYSQRVLSELKEFEAVGKRMSELGKAGAKAKAEKKKSDSQATAEACVKRALSDSQADGERADSVGLTKENKIKKNKIKENKENISVQTEGVLHNDISPSDALFDEFWKAYPRKEKKKDAHAAFMKIKNIDETITLILEAIAKFKQTDKWKKDNGQYIPLPTTFLNGERWNDEIPNLTIGYSYNGGNLDDLDDLF